MRKPEPHATRATAGDLADLLARIGNTLRLVPVHTTLPVYQTTVLHALRQAEEDLRAGAQSEAASTAVREDMLAHFDRRVQDERRQLENRLRELEAR